MSKLFVPTELLEKLHCSSCNSYLSVFPIYVRYKGDLPICGRCKIPNEDEYLRDEAYEGIAQFLIFPCIETKNGCSEQLTPLKLKDHEDCCTFRKMDCPSKIFSRCNWQGANKDLKSHFETTHSNLLITNGKFEIQFVNSIKENLLMPYENELFIIKREIDSRARILICSVQHVTQHEDQKKYNYYLKIETADGLNSFRCHERPTYSLPTQVTLEEIKEKLHDPAAVFCCIGINKATLKQEEEVKIKKDDSINNPLANSDLLLELECPICLEYLQTPILQCLNGHNICSTCKPKVNQCPTCKEDIRNTRNFALEGIIARQPYPCKYRKMGCSIVLNSTEIRKHEALCEYGPYDCPLKENDDCTTQCFKSEIIKHVESNHNEHVLKSDKINIPFQAENNVNMEEYYLIKFSMRIFKVCFKYQNEKFYWTLQLVGPAEECHKYKFEIDVIDNSERNLRQCIQGVCVPLTKQCDCFTKKGDFVFLLYDQISDYITTNLSYRLRIVKE